MNILISILRAISSLIPVEDAPSVLTYRTDKSEEEYQAWRLEREREVAEFYNVDYRDIDDNYTCITDIR